MILLLTVYFIEILCMLAIGFLLGLLLWFYQFVTGGSQGRAMAITCLGASAVILALIVIP